MSAFLNNEILTNELMEFVVDSSYSKECSIKIKMLKKSANYYLNPLSHIFSTNIQCLIWGLN